MIATKNEHLTWYLGQLHQAEELGDFEEDPVLKISKYIVHLATKFVARFPGWVSVEELISEANFEVCKHIKKWNRKCPLTTFSVKRIVGSFYNLLKTRRRWGRDAAEEFDNPTLQVRWGDIDIAIDVRKMIEKAVKERGLTYAEEAVLKDHYLKGFTLLEIAKKRNLGDTSAFSVVKKAKGKLLELFHIPKSREKYCSICGNEVVMPLEQRKKTGLNPERFYTNNKGELNCLKCRIRRGGYMRKKEKNGSRQSFKVDTTWTVSAFLKKYEAFCEVKDEN